MASGNAAAPFKIDTSRVNSSVFKLANVSRGAAVDISTKLTEANCSVYFPGSVNIQKYLAALDAMDVFTPKILGDPRDINLVAAHARKADGLLTQAEKDAKIIPTS